MRSGKWTISAQTMSNVYLRKITNSFQDVRLVSLASWKQANEISPRDRNGPYIVIQEGYDPDDPKMLGDQFVLGRAGQWLSFGQFFKMRVAERRAEFVFGTTAEVIQVMQDLPSKVVMLRPGSERSTEPENPEADEMAAAFKAAQTTPAGQET